MNIRYIQKIKKVLILLSVFILLIPSFGCQVASELTDPDKYTKVDNSEPWEKKGVAKAKKKETKSDEPKPEDF